MTTAGDGARVGEGLRRARERLWACAAIACAAVFALLLQGCATTQMKGTPFYTGEYSVRRGPAEERINLWPLLYYREPALSVLWPLAELTDDHFAIRPLMSVYGLNTDHHVYNVLWPIARFDPKRNDNRIFPLFWGDDYCVAFPLYWHFDDPWKKGGTGYDALLPLWSHRRAGNGHSTHVLWPFLHRKNMGGKHGWRVWPLYGQYADGEDRYRFYMWPLGHRWHEATGDEGDCLLPLYYRSRDEKGKRFLSLLYNYGEDATGDKAWQLAFPLWYAQRNHDDRLFASLLGGYKRSGDDLYWAALPLLSGGRKSSDSGEMWGLGPLTHYEWGEDTSEHHIFPLYYRSKTPERSRFFSLLWNRDVRADGGGWDMLVPFCYRFWEEDSSAFFTPLYSRGCRADGSKWHSITPLMYRSMGEHDRVLATLLGGYRKRDDELTWAFLPAVAGGHRDSEESSLWALGPLMHFQRDDAGKQQHILPFFYRNTRTGTFISPLAAQMRRGDKTTRIVPPALSWWTQAPDRSDLWVLGPLAHFSWGEEAGSSHIFPLYYSNRGEDVFLTPLYMSAGKDDRLIVVPPLLSLYRREAEQRDLYAALGLFHTRWGEGVRRRGYMFPLYAFEEDEFLYTPLSGRKRGNDGFVYPLTPLVGWYTGDGVGGWAFPFFSYRRNRITNYVDGSFLLFGDYQRHGNTMECGLPLVFGYHKYPAIDTYDPDVEGQGTYGKKLWITPFYASHDLLHVHRNRTAIKQGKQDVARSSREKRNRLFPLWSYKSTTEAETGHEDTRGSVLLLLYDYRHRIMPQLEGGTDDYCRARVLWRFWHYERANGDVSIDLFPAITYDRKTDGLKKFSFLWRAFRYERRGDRKSVDVLFLPIVRREGEAHDGAGN